MKKIYFIVAVLFFGFTSCKNAENTDVENSNDTISVQQDKSVEVKDTVAYDTTSTVNDTSDVKLLNKNSTSTSTTYSDPAKGKFALAETKWRLVELNGNAVDPNTRKDYYINFDSKSGTFKAFVGCNNITGNYFMKSEGKLGFANIISTRKACNDMNVERNFFNNLQKTDNYIIEANGKVLHLHVGKKAVAKFEAIK